MVIGHLSTGNNDGNCDGYDGNDTGYSDVVIEVVIIVAVIVVISINFALFLANRGVEVIGIILGIEL